MDQHAFEQQGRIAEILSKEGNAEAVYIGNMLGLIVQELDRLNTAVEALVERMPPKWTGGLQ